MEPDGISQSERAQAHELISKLSVERGFVKKEYWDELGEGARTEFQQALRGLQGLVEPAAKVAQSLYSSTARFVFELLQNAEDNNFFHARGSPYVSFRLNEDRLIINCNEDGFTPEDLKAICSIGKSSKLSTLGYIGEKGIGFKSVFMAAWKVHIQSGPYSFYFEHHPSDGGMGMVTPIWQKPTEELPRHMTRMTLHLHTEGDHQSILAQRHNILQQLRELNGNVLLFMRKLKGIGVTIEENGIRTSTIFSKSEIGDDRMKISKTVTQDDGDSLETSSTLYYITKHRVRNLPKNENRSYSEGEDRLKEYSTAEVILAFPLTPECEPIIESQDVFAFLPVESAGFSFLIQGDFVTSANRENIVTTSGRNIGLRDGIYAAFIEAALEFCNHETLQYTWMKFLPDRKNKAYSDFWSALITNIEAKVLQTPLIRPDSGGPLQLIASLRNPRPMFVDKENNLLLRDLTPELSISRNYGRSSLAILENLGLINFQWLDFIGMVDQDLQSSDSWIKYRISDDYLQTNVADLLIRCYKTAKGNWARSMIEKLPLIPLEDDRWLAATTTEKLFYPDTAGLTVPEDLGFSLVEPFAANHPKWRELFGLLGVESLSVGNVRERIFQRHLLYKKVPGTIRSYEQQLKFLYSTHDSKTNDTDPYWNVLLVDDSMDQSLSVIYDIYLPDDTPLGPRELLKPTVGDDNSTEGAPGLNVDFIHEYYLEDVPEPPRQESLPWRDWLVEVIGVRRLLRLVNVDSSPMDLSQACYYVAKHRPEKFFAFLIHHWLLEGSLVIKNAEVKQKLRKIKTLCQGKHMLELEDTYLPFPDLLSQSTRFLAKKVDFPFLQLEQPIDRRDYSPTWASLTGSLGIKGADDLEFYLRILLAFSTVQSLTEDDCRRVFELYSTIHGKYLQLMFKDDGKQLIQSYFKENSVILVPSVDGRECTWAPLAGCLWEAPSCLRSRYPLKASMKSFLAEFSSLSNFFVEALEMPDCEYSHILEELRYLLENVDPEVEVVSGLYKQLDTMSKNLPASVQEEIKSMFENEHLIYVEKDGYRAWYQVPECLWASPSEMPGWGILEPLYKDLNEFFVNFLGVKTLSLELVYGELDRLGSSSDATRDQVESNIRTLNSFITDGAWPPGAETLLDRRIFPVRYPDGKVQLETAAVEFVIVDRKQLGTIFEPRAKTLDFDLDEVRRLGPTLSWLGLGTRYLSEAVREVSRVHGASKEPLSAPARSIKPRAHALYRIAYHYNSPRLKEGAGLYETLKNAQIYETDGIAATLYINQDGHKRCYEKGQSDLHIEEEEEKLSIFVPRDKKSQESCYARKLPLGLFRWLMTPPDGSRVVLSEKGLRVTASVLNSSRFVLSDILDDEGIAAGGLGDDYEEDGYEVEEEDVGSSDEDPIDTPAFAETEAEETPGLETPISSRLATPSRASHEVATGLPILHQPAQSRPASSPNLARDVSYIQARSDVASTSHRPAVQPIPSVPALHDQEAAQYQALLKRVVTAARGSPGLPSQGAYDMTKISHALSDVTGHSSSDGVDQFSPFRSSSQQERDRKIGAAGELYVFERLKNLSPRLHGFSLDNWRSTIRRYVSAHRDYAKIPPWNHRETSDFEYNDSKGDLTKLLIENGYLEGNIWENRKPRYYLEVKTTTGPCEAPFYMSKSQYRLIHECQDSMDKIYVVFRVYEVERATVQLRVYVNPARLEGSGRLVYTAETWSVRPGAGA